MERSTNRIDGVDGLRGLAILFVLMNHVNMQLLFAGVPYTRGLPKQLVSSLVWNGQQGVQIFFAVSGFLITSTTLRRWGRLSAVNAWHFYRLRFARIAPLLLLLLAVLSALHLAGVKHFVVGEKTGGLGGALLSALTFRLNWLEASRGYLPGNWDILWSLSIEEMFYLFFPVCCRLLGRGHLLVFLLLGFVVLGPFGRTVLTHGNPVWEEYSYLGGMDAIALGCLTALVMARHRFSSRELAGLGVAGGLLGGFLLCCTRTRVFRELDRHGLSMSLLAVGACMLIIVAAQTQWSSPKWMRPLLTMGRLSYEVYLTHMFVVLALFGWFSSAGKPLGLVPVLFAAVVVVSGIVGWVVARGYAEPMNRWLRRSGRRAG